MQKKVCEINSDILMEKNIIHSVFCRLTSGLIALVLIPMSIKKIKVETNQTERKCN